MTALRDEVVDAILPAAALGLPAADPARRAAFWEGFERSASPGLRLGFRVAVAVAVWVAPWWLGLPPWRDLNAGAREEVLTRLGAWPGGADLVEVLKLVACLAVFEDDTVQLVWRARR